MWTTTRSWENSLEELIQDCRPATFGCGDKNVFDEKIRKAGALAADSISTNFNPYDFGIVDAVARELLPGLVRAGKQPAVERGGIVAELYQLNVYSGPSGMFKSHVDTPRGRTHFGSLVVVLPTEFQGSNLTQTLTIRRARVPNMRLGGQLKIVHKDQERVSLERRTCEGTIKWVAFYSDCKHEVLPVSTGNRVTLTYHLYVSEHMGGLVQLQLQRPDSKAYLIYRSVKNLLASSTFMKNGGVLGFHCAFQYPETEEGTYNYERYPLTLKGIDAVIFSVFRAFGLTVHIKPYDRRVKISDIKTQHQVLPAEGTTGGELGNSELPNVLAYSSTTHEQLEKFGQGGYIGDEIFNHVNWLNDSS
ncbi:hypothetical protein IL306_002889 [Fusarium sp. DS 682]|nr:hypothetical protein IL306_002889 [Fusarium sp. DS 682]